MNKKKSGIHFNKTTMNPEFVPSFHNWITPEKQKNRANELATMTENDDKENKK